MSVFGGDSWSREAQQRKRRVDDLLSEDLDVDSFKKLSNGKYACLICPHNPVFDSSLILSMHNKGSRHNAAKSRLKERELMRQEEIKKRIALSDGSLGNVTCGTSTQHFQLNSKQMMVPNARTGNCKQINSKGKPLLERAQKAAAEALSSQKPEQEVPDRNLNTKRKCYPFFSSRSLSSTKPMTEAAQSTDSVPPSLNEQTRGCVTEESVNMLLEHHLELVKRRERELNFTAAGWKRNCNGRWYRDENVEFDSDEEDPNLCLS